MPRAEMQAAPLAPRIDPYYESGPDINLDIPASITQERSRHKRWIAMHAYLQALIDDGRDWVTRAVVAPPIIRTLISEVLHNKTRDEDNRALEADMPLPYLPVVRLATVDGAPLAKAARDRNGRVIANAKDPTAHMRGVKVGQHALDAKALKRWAQIGREHEIYREYGSDFEVSAVDAFRLLHRFGYRCSYPTYYGRNTGRQRLRTPLFEVNGPFHEEVVSLFGWKDTRAK